MVMNIKRIRYRIAVKGMASQASRMWRPYSLCQLWWWTFRV